MRNMKLATLFNLMYLFAILTNVNPHLTLPPILIRFRITAVVAKPLPLCVSRVTRKPIHIKPALRTFPQFDKIQIHHLPFNYLIGIKN